ncbi:MAG: hypothetical protein M3Y53_00910 [Thermoproteota archaeon]|nr:hypothetical protein [Thermoproteota archaeon]
MVVIGYVDTDEVMSHILDKEHRSEVILSTPNVVASDTAVQSIILISILYLTSDNERQRMTQGDGYNWR